MANPRTENMQPNDDSERLIRQYEAMLAAVREVAERLRARLDDLRARFPDAPDTSGPPGPGQGAGEEPHAPADHPKEQ